MTTIATSTQQAYTERAVSLLNRAKRELNQTYLTPLQLAEWLVSLNTQISKATWRQYKSALCYVFNLKIVSTPGTSDTLSKAIALLKQSPPPEGRPRTKQTSAKKQKKISEDAIVKLFDCLYHEKSKHGQAAIQWFLAGLWTGLRPCEWETAFYVPSTRQLVVLNAKATQGRSHGKYRHINLTNLDENERAVIQLHLQNVRKARLNPHKNGQSGFTRFYEQCRQRMHRANKKLWPRRQQTIALYTARHQFAADAKYSGLSKEAIAALMGHNSIETAGLHYGRLTAGRGGFQVTADEQDIKKVEALNKNRPQKNPPWTEDTGLSPTI